MNIFFLIGTEDCFNLLVVLDNDWSSGVSVALEDMEELTATIQQARESVTQHPWFKGLK